ncbi:hypothetical protein OAF61_02065 [Pseudomonadales bacterium]|nr:hypothetical protein [Pseudomonadales bacterium]
MDLPESIKGLCFNSFSVLNESERAVVMFGEEEYRRQLDLENDDAPCWVTDSGETHGFVGWNPQCIPTIDYIVWKIENLEKIRKGKLN